MGLSKKVMLKILLSNCVGPHELHRRLTWFLEFIPAEMLLAWIEIWQNERM